MKREIVESVDANTGEKVHKCAVPKDFQEEMHKVLKAHNDKMQEFMVLSQQLASLAARWLLTAVDLEDLKNGKENQPGILAISKTDERFKTKMRYLAKKLKLPENEPWTWNIQENCFEMRLPPAPEPMTASAVNSQQPEKVQIGT